MDSNKLSNFFSYLKDKYGEESVRLLRLWEFTVKKMADHRNHKRFTLWCIKAGITPVSCKIRNSLKLAEVIISFTRQKDSYFMKESKYKQHTVHV